jgi:hypothetical protein
MTDAVKIEVIQEGGFAGIRRTAVLDTRLLSEAEASALCRLIDAASFFSLPSSLMTSEGADRLTYIVTVERPGQRYTLRTNTAEDHPALHELIQYVKTRARS